ncbi:NAD-dependent epimerase/dehydratase family protein [Brevibacillus laterosporus]|uniref:NAD-dependent epimerase/dehydratase family protein n=1 Tax=Brevibacillus laterosporus TaxID=1465 RepID=A0A502H3A4_BRELA|nr:NAD-dependent epimerase/dehydratase family protein [Brevibacillus laterosporus]QDX93877.1 NAD-dependent epimerase/dehydratase family protein [Brevibacillus laterosporus]TPG67823.1 NAD-dependent epimerase/dehydratase family protein [Brevibacillus laterosporus]TPG89483.1 NAD-dependent epimerase/dehydratase family protein [Brevibacillus laterosporus]
MRKKAVVTGCAGFIGSHLTERLLAEDYEVIGVDSLLSNYPLSYKERNIAHSLQDSRFHYITQPVQDVDWSYVLKGVHSIFHLAALPGVRASWGDAFQEYVNHNVTATQILLEASLTHDTLQKIVLASSSSVYGTMQEGLSQETAPLVPLSPYGVTKVSMEYLMQAYVKAYQLPVVALRYFTVYGPRQRPDMAFHRFFRAMIQKDPIQIYGDGSQSRNFSYVHDVVEANLLASEYGQAGEIYNIGGEREISLLEAVSLMAKILRVKPDITFTMAEKGDSRRTCADISLAAQQIGYRPHTSLEQGLYQQFQDIKKLYQGG